MLVTLVSVRPTDLGLSPTSHQTCAVFGFLRCRFIFALDFDAVLAHLFAANRRCRRRYSHQARNLSSFFDGLLVLAFLGCTLAVFLPDEIPPHVLRGTHNFCSTATSQACVFTSSCLVLPMPELSVAMVELALSKNFGWVLQLFSLSRAPHEPNTSSLITLSVFFECVHDPAHQQNGFQHRYSWCFARFQLTLSLFVFPLRRVCIVAVPMDGPRCDTNNTSVCV